MTEMTGPPVPGRPTADRPAVDDPFQLGGVTFGSGKGGVLGPTVAAFMLVFAFNFLTSLGLGEPGKQMAQGAIIAMAAIAYAARGSRT